MQTEKAMSGRRTIESQFDVDKAIAAVGYLVEKTGATMYSIMKMMYLADKIHLERYGRFIAGDNYVAMSQGPVPSCTYNMIKHVRGEALMRPGDERACAYFSYAPDHQIALRQPPDVDELSNSDVQCLEEVATIYRKVGPWAVRDLSHDDAWESAWGSSIFRRAKAMSAEQIARQFENAGSLIEHMQDRSPGSANLPEA